MPGFNYGGMVTVLAGVLKVVVQLQAVVCMEIVEASAEITQTVAIL